MTAVIERLLAPGSRKMCRRLRLIQIKIASIKGMPFIRVERSAFRPLRPRRASLPNRAKGRRGRNCHCSV
jgi:hypothetical protein